MLSRAFARSLRRTPPLPLHSTQPVRSSQWLCQSCSGVCRRISTASKPAKSRKAPSRDPSPGRVPRTRNISSSLEPVSNISFDPLFAMGAVERQKQRILPQLDPLYSRNDSGQVVIQASRIGILGRQDLFTRSISATELLQNINACTFVGKFERAKEIVRRMMTKDNLNMADVQEANRTLLRGMVHYCRMRKNADSMAQLRRWYELDMKMLGIAPCAASIAQLCKAAILLDNPKGRSRTLRRYLATAEDMGFLADTLSSPELDPVEFETMCQVREDLFKAESETQSDRSELNTNSPEEEISIKPTAQEGLGLATLLSSIRSLEHVPTVPKNVSEKTLHHRQLKLESHVYEAEAKRWEAEHNALTKMGINPSLSEKSILANLWEWKTALEGQIKQHIEQLHSEENNERDALAAVYFEALPVEKISSIAIMNVLSAFSKTVEGLAVSTLINNIGNQLADEHFADRNMHSDSHKSRWRIRSKRRALLRQLAANKLPMPEDEQVRTNDIRSDLSLEWPSQMKAAVGGLLLTKLVEVAKLPTPVEGSDQEKPKMELVRVFEHAIEWENGRPRGKINPHAALIRMLARNKDFTPDQYLPMIAPPRPWEKARGAYLRRPASLMRVTDSYGLQSMYLEAALSNGDIDEVLKALNILSTTPWTIHADLLKIMVEAWNTGEAMTNFPPVDAKLEYPAQPDEDTSQQDKRAYYLRVKQLNDLTQGYQSNRCFINMQLELARVFRDIPIYFPYNIDFRGRAYPVPGTLNHMGADHVRALCIFDQGKELGDEGLFWLKVHAANKFGANKKSLEDRAKFIDEHYDDVKDSANNPIDGRRWWMDADDPWQMLAACLELSAALESPEPARFVSRLPIQQDGSCNGLQHYAALGGDVLGAAQVNLVPSDKPADIYSRIGEMVSAEVDRDAASGNEAAKRLKGKISRKIVKRPVMTNVYGVTGYGVIRQVKQELDEVFPIEHESGKDNFQLAAYVSKKIFHAFGNIFTGATQIQDWLADCASIISTSLSQEQVESLSAESVSAVLQPTLKQKSTSAKNKRQKKDKTTNFQGAVVWTTPLGLPVAQPYRSSQMRVAKTTLQTVMIKQPSPSLSVSHRKQRSAFPPNFVHSLDATHMMMTAVECDRAGLTFASVHDSFWTHAADIPVMNRVLREQFVKMHSEDVIKRLAEEFRMRHKGSFKFLNIPRHTPFFERLKKWRKKHKPDDSIVGNNPAERRKLYELKLESQRSKLLKSDDAAEREKGEKMVTPASMYEALGPDSEELKVVVEETEVDVVVEDSFPVAENAELGEVKASSKSKKKAISTTPIWVPIQFPPLPAKGGLDINLVLQSQYFFS